MRMQPAPSAVPPNVALSLAPTSVPMPAAGSLTMPSPGQGVPLCVAPASGPFAASASVVPAGGQRSRHPPHGPPALFPAAGAAGQSTAHGQQHQHQQALLQDEPEQLQLQIVLHEQHCQQLLSTRGYQTQQQQPDGSARAGRSPRPDARTARGAQVAGPVTLSEINAARRAICASMGGLDSSAYLTFESLLEGSACNLPGAAARAAA